MPRNFAWLIRLVPQAAGYGGQLQHLLSDPKMVLLIQAAPQAGRLLRPLCRALAIPIPERLQLPKPAPRPAPPCSEPRNHRHRPDPPGPPPGPPGPQQPVVVWRRWRGLRMPEPVRPKLPA